jgi:hypothetical protein
VHGINLLINAAGEHMLQDAIASHNNNQYRVYKAVPQFECFEQVRIIQASTQQDRHFNRHFLIVSISVTVTTVDFMCNLQNGPDTLVGHLIS